VALLFDNFRRKSPSLQFESLTPLPEGLWIVSWDTWLKIANTIVLSNPNINDKM
jgi:hypothetical protein